MNLIPARIHPGPLRKNSKISPMVLFAVCLKPGCVLSPGVMIKGKPEAFGASTRPRAAAGLLGYCEQPAWSPGGKGVAHWPASSRALSSRWGLGSRQHWQKTLLSQEPVEIKGAGFVIG